MKLLFCDENPELCRKTVEQLEGAGIPARVREPEQDSLFPGNTGTRHEVWIMQDNDFDKAWRLLNREPPTEEVVEPEETA